MAKLLGTAYEVGKSDCVVSRKPDSGTALEEGLFVKETSATEVGLAAGGRPFGVMGQQEAVACGVITSGYKVAVQLDDGITPTIGQTVYVSAVTNKATNTDNSDANAGTNATFTGVYDTDGRSDNTATKKTTVRWAEINMPNGL
jgi:hypothetical protein